MRRIALRHTLLLALGASVAGALQGLSALGDDFSTFPESAQQCLDNAASTSGCTGDTAAAINSCLCSNGGNFVTKTAVCVGSTDPEDLGDVYEGLTKHCADADMLLTVTKTDFMRSSGVTSTMMTRTKTKTKTSTKTSSTSMGSTSTGESKPTGTGQATATSTTAPGNSGGSGMGEAEQLSGTAKAGIIGGAVGGGLLVAGLAIFAFVRKRRRAPRGPEESHPMLSQTFTGISAAGAPEGPGVRTSKMSMASMDSVQDDDVEVFNAGASLVDSDPTQTGWKPDTKWRPSSGFNWESPYEPLWSPPPGSTTTSPAPPVRETWEQLPLETAPATFHAGSQQVRRDPEVFELASPDTQIPVEMAAPPASPHQYPAAEHGTTKPDTIES